MKKLTMEEMDILARLHGGKCNSVAYEGIMKKLEWECSLGHTWMANPSNMKSGHWCPHCSKKAKHNLKEVQKFAKQNHAICLDNVYTNNGTIMKWKCMKCNTQWDKSYHGMKDRKYFCQICRKIKRENKC